MMNWTFFFHQNMVTLAFFSQINPLYSLQPPTFLKQVAKKLPKKNPGATEIEKKWVPLQQFLLCATKKKKKKSDSSHNIWKLW